MNMSPIETPSDRPAATGLLRSPESLDTPWHNLSVRALGAFARFVFTLFFHLKVMGIENVPAKGPALVTINHLSVMDIPALGSVLIGLGFMPGVNIFTIAKQELFQKPVLPFLMPRLGMVAIYRNQIDLNAMRAMLTILKRGAFLGIAPEGARSPSGHLQLFQPGVAKLAIQKRIPILPIGMTGMEQVLPIGAKFPHSVPISVRFGPVYELSEYYGKELTPELLERAAWDMRQHIADLLPDWMRQLPPEDATVRFGAVGSSIAPTSS